jgi:hypothetical protein
MRGRRHSVEHERRRRRSLSDASRTQHSNLGLRDWKSESFESWTFFSLRVDSTKHDDCGADNQKSLLTHASVQSLRRLSSKARDQFGYAAPEPLNMSIDI